METLIIYLVEGGEYDNARIISAWRKRKIAEEKVLEFDKYNALWNSNAPVRPHRYFEECCSINKCTPIVDNARIIEIELH